MSWQVFGGDAHEVYLALLKERCQRDGLGTSGDVLARQFRLHLHRGMGYLAAPRTIRSIGDLIQLTCSTFAESYGERSRDASTRPPYQLHVIMSKKGVADEAQFGLIGLSSVSKSRANPGSPALTLPRVRMPARPAQHGVRANQCRP